MSERERKLRLGYGDLCCRVLISATFMAQLGCDQSPTRTTGPNEVNAYAMNVVVSHVPFWSESKAMADGISGAWEDELVFGGPESEDVLAQTAEIEALLARGIDGLIIAPTDSTQILPTLNELNVRNIPFVTFLVDAPESNRVTYITSELEEASIRLLNSVQEKLPTSGEAVIMIGTAGSEEQERRAAGFREFLGENTSIEVTAVIEDSFDERTGADHLKSVLLSRPSVNVILGANSRSAAAALTAIRELGLDPGDFFITGWDKDRDVLQAIERGEVVASAGQNSAFMVYLAYSVLELYNEMEPWPQGLQVPTTIVIPVDIIQGSNVSSFLQEPGLEEAD